MSCYSLFDHVVCRGDHWLEEKAPTAVGPAFLRRRTVVVLGHLDDPDGCLGTSSPGRTKLTEPIIIINPQGHGWP